MLRRYLEDNMKKEQSNNIELSGKTVVLAFDRYEEAEELKDALKGGDYHLALWNIAQEVFRPHRKHGYADERLNELNQNAEVNEAIGILESMFYDILKERGIEF